MKSSELSVMERCKTFDDACELTGVNVLDFQEACKALPKHVTAYVKLCIIARALNGDWKPEFSEDERRYYPYFVIYWRDEWEQLSDEHRKELEQCGALPIPAGVGGAYGGAVLGVSVLAADDVSYAAARYGGALASKNREIALYFGKAFHEIWNDYLFAVV